MSTISEQPETIKVLNRSLRIMDTLMEIKQPMGVNEIAKICGINLSTAFRILKTLKINGWVFQCEDDRYIPGEKISFVTEKNNFYMALKEVSFYVMNELTKRESQAMNLVVRQQNSCIILQQSRTNRLIDFVPPVGTSLPIHASAAGKLLTCELPDVLKKVIMETISFELLTPNTISRKNDFIMELEKVNEQHYAFDFHESIENGCCIAVPVRNKTGEIIAALSFSGIIGITDSEQLLYYLPILNQAAVDITEKLYVMKEEYLLDSEGDDNED